MTTYTKFHIFGTKYKEMGQTAPLSTLQKLPQLRETVDRNEIRRWRNFSPGKIIVSGKKTNRQKSKRTDCAYRYISNFPFGVVESKKSYKTAADVMQQAKKYAEITGLNLAYTTVETEIINQSSKIWNKN